MEPTAVSISSQMCWRWSIKIDHRHCSGFVEVSGKSNANGGNRRALRAAEYQYGANHWTTHIYRLSLSVAITAVMKPEKRIGANGALGNLCISHSVDVLFNDTAVTL